LARVEVVLAGFVDDADEAELGGAGVGDANVDLAWL
jgi:hypothetical protein